MGTRTDMGRGRRGKRGLASFVSFLLLFAFALGSSSLVALADNGGAKGNKKAVSSDETLPAADAPAEEAPIEEAPAAEEAPVEEAPAEEAPSADDGSDAGASTEGATATSRAAPKASQLQTASAGRGAGILSHGGLHGGDVSLDFVAAGPFTYDHNTGLGTHPQFGYDNRTISKTNGVVESLEGGDFECGDLVTFFVQVVIAEDAEGSGTVELDMSFGAETTGQPGLGFDNIVSYGINTPDDGNVGNVGDNVVTASPPNGAIETSGYDELKATLTVTNLAPGETAIVRVTVHLECEVGASPTGNVLNAIESARADGERISVGQQTVPMKQVGGLDAAPSIDVTKDCPAAVAAGEEIAYEITVTNTGNVELTNITVVDDIIGDLSDEFPDTLAVGSDPVTVEVQYTPVPADGDPVTNTVTATGDWEAGETSDSVSDTAECTTDITHEPGILVVKECPESVPFGADVTFTITVTNTGNESLENVLVTDELLGGDITGDFDFADPFPVGGEESAEFTYTPGPNEDPVENSVTASGDGVDSEVTATSTDDCDTDVIHAPAIEVTKSCPALVASGEDVTFTITVTNTGNEDLGNVSVTDELLGGDITDAFEFGETFAVGAEASAQFNYTPGADEDPVENSVTASGVGVHSEITVTSTDVCVTDISNPAIQIVKTVSEEVVPVGTTVTYTYVITNTGDVTLYDISVDDDIMGHIGDIPVLEPGSSVTLTKDFVVGDEPVVNVGTAVGEDILGRVVSDDDDAFVSPIAGENPPNPPNNPPTPFTGSDAGRLGLITMILAGIGVTVVASTRRRRSEREAA